QNPAGARRDLATPACQPTFGSLDDEAAGFVVVMTLFLLFSDKPAARSKNRVFDRCPPDSGPTYPILHPILLYPRFYSCSIPPKAISAPTSRGACFRFPYSLVDLGCPPSLLTGVRLQ